MAKPKNAGRGTKQGGADRAGADRADANRSNHNGGPPSPTLAGVSDTALWAELRSRGGRSHACQRAFAGLIPEAARRLLHQRPGYGSVAVLARRMGGLCEHSVKEVLRLDRQLADRPRLRALLETGRVGWSKLRAVASVATAADEAEWARHVVTLPKEALEALVRARRRGLGVEEPRDQPLAGAGGHGGAPADASRAAHGQGAAGAEAGAAARCGNGPQDAPGPDAGLGAWAGMGGAAGGAAGGATRDPHADPPSGPEPGSESTTGAPVDEDGPDAEHDAGRTSEGESASSEQEAPSGSVAPSPGEGLLPEDYMVSVRLRPRAAELLQRMARHLRKTLRSTMTLSDVVETLVSGYSDAKVRPLQYCEVIVRGHEAGGPAYARTRFGDVRVTEEDVARGQAARPPVDLEQARLECKARVAGAPGGAGRVAPSAEPSGPRPGPAPRADVQPSPAEPRHIPAHVRHFLELRFGGFCAFPKCRHPATILHHVNRFALDPSHDPDGIVPLCKAHEALAHAGLIANEKDPPERWLVQHRRSVPDAQAAAVARVDAQVAGHRRPQGESAATDRAAAGEDEPT